MSTKFTDELMGMMVKRQLLNSYFFKIEKESFLWRLKEQQLALGWISHRNIISHIIFISLVVR